MVVRRMPPPPEIEKPEPPEPLGEKAGWRARRAHRKAITHYETELADWKEGIATYKEDVARFIEKASLQYPAHLFPAQDSAISAILAYACSIKPWQLEEKGRLGKDYSKPEAYIEDVVQLGGHYIPLERLRKMRDELSANEGYAGEEVYAFLQEEHDKRHINDYEFDRMREKRPEHIKNANVSEIVANTLQAAGMDAAATLVQAQEEVSNIAPVPTHAEREVERAMQHSVEQATPVRGQSHGR